MKENQKHELKEATEALLSMPAVPHQRPKKPTKADLGRKWIMRVDVDGKPRMIEITD